MRESEWRFSAIEWIALLVMIAVIFSIVFWSNTSTFEGGSTGERAVRQPSTEPTSAAVGKVKNMTTTIPEAETHIAVQPNNGSLWVGGVSDFSLRSGYNTTKYAYSRNRGSTWSQHFVPLDPITSKPMSADALIWESNSDPVVAMSSTRVYLTSLYFNESNNANGLYVASAPLPVSGPIFTSFLQVYPVKVNASPFASDFEDKPWITVDPTSGAVYIVWAHFTPSSDSIYFSTSIDNGQTWSVPMQISPPSLNGAVQGAQVAAGSSGKVYVSWTTFFVGGVRRIYGAKSTNYGATFTTTLLDMSPYYYTPNFASIYRKESFPAMVVDPFTNTVHLTFSAQASNGTAKVVYSRNVNGAWPSTAFTTPINVINTNFGNQFFPSIAVDPALSGRVQLAWFDTRNSRSDVRRLDIYAKRSLTNGASFQSKNERVTPSSTFVGNTSFVGDYMGVAIHSGIAMPAYAFFVTPMRTALVS